jgi:hypothetical protein
MALSELLTRLSAEFPRDVVSWRAQSLTKDGTKAMALAYIDARDVMDRLDDVVGPEGWQCDYPHAGQKTVCRIGIKIGDEWVWKANGAGDSDIEAEKGALSDAFKRAAVLWGIGRYLYSLDAPWVPCESGEWNGKKQWKRWTADPWRFVKGEPQPSKAQARDPYKALQADMAKNRTKADLRRWWNDPDVRAIRQQIPADWDATLMSEMTALAAALPEDEPLPEKARLMLAG